jgi:amino acid transporter
MLESLDSPIKIAISIYLFAFALLYIFKPKLMFTHKKNLREFGTSKNKTILPIWLVSAIIGILAYISSALVINFLKPLYNKVLSQQLIDMNCD